MLRPRPAAVLLDVGFTLTSYDGERIATLVAEAGGRADPAAIHETERAVRRELVAATYAFRPDRPARGSDGARLFERILTLAGATAPPGATLERVAEHVWTRHLERNVFRRVLPGVPGALADLRAAGLRLAVVSNSEGTVEAMLEEVGLRPLLETVVDSWAVRVAKPDPRIFAIALDRLALAPEAAIMVGDSPVADVAGASAAGVRAALIDPYDLHAARAGASEAHAAGPVPRFADLASFAAALLSAA